MTKTLSLKPMMSEKAYAMSQNGSTYVFGVAKNANQHDVAKAVADQYKVGVVKVRIARVPGKSQSIISRRRRLSHFGKRNDIRKAYVTLKAGDKLPIFAAVEKAEQQEAEAAAKAAKKDKK
jgi:large subunit ribosomal protein L23